jgi:hypothetical protein
MAKSVQAYGKVMRGNKKILLLVVLAAVVVCSQAVTNAQAKSPVITAAPSQVIAPALIEGTRSEMNSAGYWIGRHPYPDKLIVDPKGIKELNETIRNDLRISYDLSSYPATYPGHDLLSALQKDYAAISRLRLFQSGGAPVAKAHLSTIKENMAMGKIPSEISVRFGFVTKGADLRSLPVAEGFYQARVKRDFDQLQTSILDIGTSVAVLHTSANGKWHYVVAPLGEGWMEGSRLALCPSEAMRAYLKKTDFVVITSVKGDLYLNREMTNFYDRTRMGQRFPMVQDRGEAVEISIPGNNGNGSACFTSAFIRKKEVNRGYLPYTPRTIILQAFEFLNDPYGWGDMNGEQDCSSFIRGVFATVGIELPRNSQFQSKAGRLLGTFGRGIPLDQKREILSVQGIGGITLLGMTGHIMLYLGSVDGNPYAIHGLYGYHDKANNKESFIVVKRFVVTDLNLGRSSRIGPILKRVHTVTIIER